MAWDDRFYAPDEDPMDSTTTDYEPWGYCDWCDKPIDSGEYKHNGSCLCEECFNEAERNYAMKNETTVNSVADVDKYEAEELGKAGAVG